MKKRTLILFTNMAFAFVCVTAQPPQQPGGPGKPPSPEERVKHVSEKMEKELKLNAAQKEKLTAAYKDFFAEIEKQRKKEGKPEQPPPPPPPPVSKEVADKLSKVRDEKIKSALSADQFKKYTEIEKTMRPPMPPGKPGEQKPPPADKKQ